MDNVSPADSIVQEIITGYKGTEQPIIFEAAFHPTTAARSSVVSFHFETLDLGSLKISSGKIIACDPIVMDDAHPFAQVFPVGNFPVQLALAKFEKGERVAYSRIKFSDNPVVLWMLATKEGQEPLSLADSSFYCYGVDAGTGIFIDSVANDKFKVKDYKEWEHVFVTKADKHGYTGFIHYFDGLGLATFSTGYGDGCFASYIGFDEAGNVCRLLTDFGLVEWWKP